MSNKMLLTSSCMIFFHNSWLTSCKAMALCPVTSRHMIMCSSRITWNVERMGLLSSTLTNTHMKCGSTWLGAYISHSTWCHQQWKLIIDGYVRTTCRQDVGVEMQPDCSELTLQLLQLHQSFVCVFLRFLQVTCLHRVHHRDLDVLTKRKKEKTHAELLLHNKHISNLSIVWAFINISPGTQAHTYVLWAASERELPD